MSRFHSYLNSAKLILEAYKGDEPFAAFLKQYFSQHKKFGSGDRKQVGHLCYCFFRLGKWNQRLPLEERMLIGLFLVSSASHPVLEAFKPAWNEKAGETLDEKLAILEYEGIEQDIFPWTGMLSNGVNASALNRSFLIQPDLFLRIRPGCDEKVSQQLLENDIAFYKPSEHSVGMSNATKLEELLMIDRDVVVQDLGSQEVAGLMREALLSKGRLVWDCCAASGGKSIMAYDIDPTIKLTVTDIRESILSNLKKRFDRAGIRKFNASVLDLSKPVPANRIHDKFSLIIADVPCSGSGTWSRTPEQLYFFDTNEIERYASLQANITKNAIPFLLPGGFFLYITCSVFARENEYRVNELVAQHGLELVSSNIIPGYNRRSDTLFNALLRKPI